LPKSWPVDQTSEIRAPDGLRTSYERGLDKRGEVEDAADVKGQPAGRRECGIHINNTARGCNIQQKRKKWVGREVRANSIWIEASGFVKIGVMGDHRIEGTQLKKEISILVENFLIEMIIRSSKQRVTFRPRRRNVLRETGKERSSGSGQRTREKRERRKKCVQKFSMMQRKRQRKKEEKR
jgi:hypothetical protein